MADFFTHFKGFAIKEFANTVRFTSVLTQNYENFEIYFMEPEKDGPSMEPVNQNSQHGPLLTGPLLGILIHGCHIF